MAEKHSLFYQFKAMVLKKTYDRKT